MNDIWNDIEQLNQKFIALGISQSIDYEKYYLYSLIAHSTSIEGSTLTELETQLLFDEGLTAKGKPLIHHLMNEDLKNAYDYAKEEAKSQSPLTPAFLQKLSAILMKTTGSTHNVIAGTFDSSKGEYRLCGVTAGIGGRSYMNYQKIPAKVEEFCSFINENKPSSLSSLKEQYELSFNAHYRLATIHPWVDGNGRASRLLMNYLQFCMNLFPMKVFKEDRAEYILSLQQSQENEDNLPFLNFMSEQLKKGLQIEIERGLE